MTINRRSQFDSARRAKLVGVALASIAVGAAPALAQNPPSAAPTNPVAPVTPPNAQSVPPEKIAPPASTTPRSNLSDQLSRQKGVIQPPHVDPGMTVSPPRAGASTMPVIRPPGSAGGNRSVVPK